MSEIENEGNDAERGPETGERPSAKDRAGTAATEAIPGEAPEDNPDLEGEERFDAG